MDRRQKTASFAEPTSRAPTTRGSGATQSVAQLRRSGATKAKGRQMLETRYRGRRTRAAAIGTARRVTSPPRRVFFRASTGVTGFRSYQHVGPRSIGAVRIGGDRHPRPTIGSRAKDPRSYAPSAAVTNHHGPRSRGCGHPPAAPAAYECRRLTGCTVRHAAAVLAVRRLLPSRGWPPTSAPDP